MRITRSVRLLLFALVVFTMSASSFGQFGISIRIGPPELPFYEQPRIPGEGYLWTPGYWAYGEDGYYWVPGTWVQPPEVGLLWTPPYWGWGGDQFDFHEGYWGQRVGFYGGISYGFGYFGDGYEGGRWENDRFFYNRAVNNINVTNIHNVYNQTVINQTTINRVSYNGGTGGLTARPTAQQLTVAQERHIPPVVAQVQHVQAARTNPELRATANHGAPPIAATPTPGAFNDRGIVPARGAGAANRAPENHMAMPAAAQGNSNPQPAKIIHPRDIPPAQRPAPPTTGNPKRDQKYQQKIDNMATKQDQQRQSLQAKQDQQHQKMVQRKANDAKTQQLEQRHQQQTQQLMQKHTQQQQNLERKMQPRAPKQQAPPKQPGPPKGGQ